MANNRTSRPSGSQNPQRRQSSRPQGSGQLPPAQAGMVRAGDSWGSQGAQSYSRYNTNYQDGTKAAKTKGKKRWIALGAAMVAAMVVIVGGVYAYLFMQNISANLKGEYTESQMENIQEQLVPVTNVNDPFYVMLIGSDERADSDEMGARSDSNILVRIDPVNWIVTMVSIPRDSKIEYHGITTKFNAAYAFGDGAAGTIEAATDLCGVPISHYAEVNFDGVVALVDTIGGVTVDVPQPLDDPQAGWVTIDQAGVQTLSGAQALVFARSRHYYMDGDFSRSANQRALIQAIVEKVFSLPVTDIPSTVQQMSKCVSTDMTVNEIYSLAMQYVNSGKDMTIYSIMAPSSTAEIDGVSYVIIDEEGLADIMEVVDAGGDPNTVQTSGATTGKFEHYDYEEGLD